MIEVWDWDLEGNGHDPRLPLYVVVASPTRALVVCFLFFCSAFAYFVAFDKGAAKAAALQLELKG